MKKKFIALTLTTLLVLSFTSISYAGLFSGNDLTSKIANALSEIQSWIVKIATPAAAVAIGSGLLMKKFSFGDEEKIAVGKKLIRSTIFSYTFILLIDPVISALQSLFG
ncbi:MAG: hypothetical protein IJX99_09665 [Clostridia bacterium]|nr:hypothetical protein [Clostridia bacterium]